MSSVSRELLAQLEQDADNLYKRFNQYIPRTTCQEPAQGLRQPLQPLSTHDNNSRPSPITSTRPATSGRQMAENIVSSLKQELAADAGSQPDSSEPQPSAPAVAQASFQRARRKPPMHSSSSHSAPATASSRLNISQGSSAIIAEALTSLRRADKTVAINPEALNSPQTRPADQIASAEALAVACAAAALGTEHRVNFLAETIRGHQHEQARTEALRLLKKMGAAAAGATAAVLGMLELYPGYKPEFVALCAEVSLTLSALDS